jgi:hypothetical protein
MMNAQKNQKISEFFGSLKQIASKSALLAACVIMAFGTLSQAAELPEAPSSVVRGSSSIAPMIAVARPVPLQKAGETKVVNRTFVGLALISSGSSFADSYTTLFARENWLAKKQGSCNVEVQSPYLYGTHPTVGRAFAVASVKSSGTALAAYYLRKHHSKFWSAPLVANSLTSLEGVTQNMVACN